MTAQNPSPDTAIAQLVAKQKEYIWPCATTYYEHPVALEHGEGMHVWDSEGNRYLDCFGGVLTTSVGHARPEVVKAVTECERLRLAGLMTLPPWFEESERVRPFFRRLREVRDELRAQGQFGENQGELSMGMSHDFEIAVAEGATMLRIGTAIFGERNERNIGA